jgi:hypothetical protein
LDRGDICALIALELPLWTVRRLAFENGEWLCSLSRQPNLPMALDDCADPKHDFDKLAELRLYIEKIDDGRLRRALEGALFGQPNKSARSRRLDRGYLWRGLAVK